ncbi:hypothetical protein [Rubrimonas cliftonensis]|uniref:Uncharacterized protein n=1 Tax=Rubrimonas cliftonensis TaxID=89524 RepID=A0A1H3VNQ3_9RHOB|nr:hypothetical protein [Rubrimonas cliftonensis]SDZ75722.1 hypothetical protein SAMN05444370_101193 [Rubrimonas cliftonensis]
MPKALSDQDCEALGEKILDFLSMADEAGKTYDPRIVKLQRAYDTFEPGSNTTDVLAECVAAAAAFRPAWGAELSAIIAINIRRHNYPTSFQVAARNKAQADVATAAALPLAGSLGPVPAWTCPGAGTLAHPAHRAPVNAASIDHVVPVVDHWNSAGRFTDKATRAAWCHDTLNHVTLCGPCNSAKSAAATYIIVTGPNYSN